MTLAEFNNLNHSEAEAELQQCCGAAAWTEELSMGRPYPGLNQLIIKAESAWNSCTHSDWLQAFEQHPRIGNLGSLRKKFGSTKSWAQKEQEAAKRADDEVLQELAYLNDRYFQKFGYIFIVFATGKTAIQMLEILKQRIGNSVEDEITNAAAEQLKIAKLRLHKLLDPAE